MDDNPCESLTMDEGSINSEIGGRLIPDTGALPVPVAVALELVSVEDDVERLQESS